MTEENIFNNGIIYKIQCNDDNIKDFYIGSTTNLKKRIYQHKNRCNNENNEKHNYKVYQTIRQNGGFINWNFLIIENVSCNNKLELLTRERHFYNILKPSLNTLRPIISKYEKKEYREANKDKIKQQNKEYREVNKDKIKEYYKDNKDKIREYYKERYKANKEQIIERSKEYYEANKLQKLEYYKERYNANKDKIKEYREANKDKINERQREYRRRRKEQIKNI